MKLIGNKGIGSLVPGAIGVLAYGFITGLAMATESVPAAKASSYAIYAPLVLLLPRVPRSMKGFAVGFGVLPLSTWVSAKGAELYAATKKPSTV